MSRKIIATAMVLVAGAATSSATRARTEQTPTVTLTGCLRTGSTSTVYLLRGAASPSALSESPSDSAAVWLPEDFLIASTPAGTDLSGMVNHRIAVTGTVTDAKDGAAPPGANTAEKALKRLNAQSVKEVASNCAATRE